MKHTKKNNKKLLLILFIILFIFFIFILNKFNKNLRTNINTENNSAETTLSNKNTKQDTAEPITFTLTSLGDTLCHNTQYWDAYNSKTDAVLCINSNAVLPFAISMKQFQMIGRRNS